MIQTSSFSMALLVMINAFLFGCENPAASPEKYTHHPQTSIHIIATTGMITDITRQIVGDRASVEGLINSGVDPHLYQPTRANINTLMQADLVLYNGLHLEGKMVESFKRIAQTTTVRAIGELVDPSLLRTPPEFEGHPDPHLWMDPLAWKQAAHKIRKVLIELDSRGQEIYDANTALLMGKIDAIHGYALNALGSIPENQRLLITAHDAFGYFGQRYGFEVVGIQGISTQSEAGVRDIERIVDLLVTRNIRSVFVESTVSDRNIRALIAGAAKRGHAVSIGGSLYADAMGIEGTYEGTYIGMIDHNITAIARGLGGQAPERGMNNKLSKAIP